MMSSSSSNPLTTAPRITGLISESSGATRIEIVPGFTAKRGLGGESCKNGIIPWNKVSGESKSGRSGKISISSTSSSHVSISVPINGNLNAKSSTS